MPKRPGSVLVDLTGDSSDEDDIILLTSRPALPSARSHPQKRRKTKHASTAFPATTSSPTDVSQIRMQGGDTPSQDGKVTYTAKGKGKAVVRSRSPSSVSRRLPPLAPSPKPSFDTPYSIDSSSSPGSSSRAAATAVTEINAQAADAKPRFLPLQEPEDEDDWKVLDDDELWGEEEDVIEGANLDVAIESLVSQHLDRARRDIKDKLKKCFETDTKRAGGRNIRGALPRASLETMMPAYGATRVIPTTAEVLRAAELGEALHPCDALLLNNGVPQKIQIALNISHRFWTAAPNLPDLIDQLRGVVATHAPFNVRVVPTIYNFGKGSGTDETMLLVLLAFVRNQMRLSRRDGAGFDAAAIDIIGGILAALHRLHEASIMHNEIAYPQRQQAQADLEKVRQWDHTNIAVVPTATYSNLIRSYPAVDKMRLRNTIRRLLDEPVLAHPHLQLNADGTCVLFLPRTTTTEQVATWLCAHVQRMKDKCGREFPWDGADDELALYRYLLDLFQADGYVRHDGQVGLRDRSTGLPLVFGHRYHPLGCSVAGHDQHHQPYNLTGNRNITTELFVINRFRKTFRPAALYACVTDLLPVLQHLQDHLAQQGLVNACVLYFDAAQTWDREVWTTNCQTSLELAVVDPNRATDLRRNLDEWLGQASSCKEDCSCSGCRAKRLAVRRAQDAHRVVHGSRAPTSVVSSPEKPSVSPPPTSSSMHWSDLPSPESETVTLESVCCGVHSPLDASDSVQQRLSTRTDDYLDASCQACGKTDKIGRFEASRLAPDGRGNFVSLTP